VFNSIGQSVMAFLEAVLTFLHDLVVPVFGVHSWGWAIVLLTLIVRVLLLPLAIKQTRSMRAMQAIQPKIKEIQAKYKVDRDLMRKDPERYRAKKQKMNEEMMALYQDEGVNPAASCLPLLAQAPVFIALFWAIRGMDELQNAPFYFFTDFITVGDDGFSGLGALVSAAGWPGWLLIVVMSGTMFITQKQMMARTAATGADNPMAQQQKILLYAMPLFLAVISFQFMLGLLLYWVTTNIWQIIQQWIILRDVKSPKAAQRPDTTPNAGGKGGATSGTKPQDDAAPPRPDRPGGASSGKQGSPPAKPSKPSKDGERGDRPPARGDKDGPSSGGRNAADGGKKDPRPRPGGASGEARGPGGSHLPKRRNKRD
jgi:YidC/Oxa1 family membrane protein insertase